MFTVPDQILPSYRQINKDRKAKNIIYSCEAKNPVKMFPKLRLNGEIILLADLVPRNDIRIKKAGIIHNWAVIFRTVTRAKSGSTIDISNGPFQRWWNP